VTQNLRVARTAREEEERLAEPLEQRGGERGRKRARVLREGLEEVPPVERERVHVHGCSPDQRAFARTPQRTGSLTRQSDLEHERPLQEGRQYGARLAAMIDGALEGVDSGRKVREGEAVGAEERELAHGRQSAFALRLALHREQEWQRLVERACEVRSRRIVRGGEARTKAQKLG
jgi:hypothetical protein